MPKVSVIIPFHNRINWAVEAVQSVLDQTCSDFEIILIDDGSTEPTTQLISISDERIRYFRQEKMGVSAARNLGINLAKGEYLSFLDSDDLFLPSKLQKQVALMESWSNVALSHTSYYQISAQGEYIGEVKSGSFSGNIYPEIFLNCPIATPSVMIRKEVLGNEVRFDESLRYSEDLMLWIQISRNYPILGIDEPLVKVRMHGGNASLNSDIQINTFLNILNRLLTCTDISFLLRLKLLSTIKFRLGFIYFRERNLSQFLNYTFHAIIVWPLNFEIYSSLITILVEHLHYLLNRTIKNLKSMF